MWDTVKHITVNCTLTYESESYILGTWEKKECFMKETVKRKERSKKKEYMEQEGKQMYVALVSSSNNNSKVIQIKVV